MMGFGQFRELTNDSLLKTPKGHLSFNDEVLNNEDKEEIEGILVNLSKAHESYLASHKQALGIVSLALHQVLKIKPVDPRHYLKQLFKSDKLLYHLNEHMLRHSYRKSQNQIQHDFDMKIPNDKAVARELYEERNVVRPHLEGGRVTLTPFGPPLKAIRVPFAKSLAATLPHGLIPTSDHLPSQVNKYPKRDRSEWPTLNVDLYGKK